MDLLVQMNSFTFRKEVNIILTFLMMSMRTEPSEWILSLWSRRKDYLKLVGWRWGQWRSLSLRERRSWRKS